MSGDNRRVVPLTGSVVLGRDRSEGATVIIAGGAISGAHAQVDVWMQSRLSNAATAFYTLCTCHKTKHR